MPSLSTTPGFSVACGCPACRPAGDGGGEAFQGDVTGTRPTGLPNHIDALLMDPDGRLYGDTWQAEPGIVGQPVALTFSFLQSPPGYAATYGIEDVRPFSQAQMDAAREALRLWAEVANISFTEVGSGGDIGFGTASTGPSGFAFAPGRDWSGGGDVYLNHGVGDNTNVIPGFTAYRRLIHETGHALGLKHPGAYDVNEAPYLPTAQDNYQYTVMSYSAHPTTGYNPTTPQLFDVAAMQYLYGANTTTRAGNDVYTFSATQEQVLTVWDGGGIDHFDLSNQTVNLWVDLRDGNFSSIGVERGGSASEANVAIAYNAVIENATGGGGSDTMFGNAAANILRGNAGNDAISGFGGDDVLYGNWGGDVMEGNGGADTLYGGQDSDAIHGGGDADVLYGNLAPDVLWGGDGADTLFGGQGADRMDGGTGDDVLAGNLGDDSLTGGAGADRFVLGVGTGHDTVSDFDAAAGDRLQLVPGQTWTVSATADGALIATSGGASVTLAGIDAGQVAAGWFA